MRPLEIIIPVLLSLHLFWAYPRPRLVRLLPVTALLLTLLHFVIEGYRWQMIPLYVLTALFTLNSLIRIPITSSWKPIASLLVFVLVAVSTALPVLLPVPSIPAPSGPFRVGTRSYELTDETRRELYSGKADTCPGGRCQGPRRFQIRVWYPAEVTPSDKRAPWMPRADIFAPAIASYIHMPSFFLDHLALVKMPAFEEAMIAPTEAGYPVILFSHGWNGFNAQNTGQAIELASHGYVVVGVQHPYGAVITVFDDGTTAYNNPAALPSGAPDDEYEAAAQKLANQWAGDLGFALDTLELINTSVRSPFGGKLDLSRVGVYGHSTGGGAAIQFCGIDPRCTALLGMDPFMRPVTPEILENGVTQPSFFMFSQSWADDVASRNNELFRRFTDRAPLLLGVISIDGTAHYDFSDLPRLSPLAPRLGLKGPISGERVATIISDYLIAFFDFTLKGIPTSLFEVGNQKYNEVRLSK